jgi:hypothetical protein
MDDDDTFSVVEDLAEGGEGSEPIRSEDEFLDDEE